MSHSADGAQLSMSALEAEDDEAVIEIEPPAPKRKTIPTLQVWHVLQTAVLIFYSIQCLQCFISALQPSKTICRICNWHFLSFFFVPTFFFYFPSFTSLNLKMNSVSSWTGCTYFLSTKANPVWKMKRKMKVRDIWVNIRWVVCFGELSCAGSKVWQHAWK